MATKPLKDQNRLGLTLAVLANAVILYGLATAGSYPSIDWSNVRDVLGPVAPVGLGAIIVGVLNAQLDPMTKARIVFMRWSNPLAGSRVFTELAPKDVRIDMEALRERLGELPTEPDIQNATWYRLYREVADKPAILHANKEYLFTRDYHVLSIWILVIFGAASWFVLSDMGIRILYIGALIGQVLLTAQAARNHGNRLVCTVLAMSTPLVPNNIKAK